MELGNTRLFSDGIVPNVHNNARICEKKIQKYTWCGLAFMRTSWCGDTLRGWGARARTNHQPTPRGRIQKAAWYEYKSKKCTPLPQQPFPFSEMAKYGKLFNPKLS